MSYRKLEEIKCPCGEVFEAELFNAINVVEDPDLKEALISGEINVVCCPNCHQIFYAEHFVLYHDPSNELFAFVYPTSFAGQRSHWEKKMHDDYKRAMKELGEVKSIKYEPVLLFGLDELVEMVKDDDEVSDESRILEYIAKDIGLSVIKLHASKSRPVNIPKILPIINSAKTHNREAIIEGLKKLLNYNESLTVYRTFLLLLENDKKWKLSKELLL